jgi:hypothetical protein
VKTLEMNVVTDNSESKPRRRSKSRILWVPLFLLSLLILSTTVTFAHCDTMDGPVIKDAKIAIEKNNINYVLIWIQPQDEEELRDAFLLTMKVRILSPDAMVLADKYFFETLVRLHRSGEGVPFTGVKPSGTPIDEKILAADKSIETGNLTPIKGLVPGEIIPELEKRFNKAMSLKVYDVNNIEAGRAYIESYVQFFKFAEGEEGNQSVVPQDGAVHSGHQH